MGKWDGWNVDAKSKESLERLADHLCEGGVIALVGAGLSQRAGLPGWETLLNDMEAAARALPDASKQRIVSTKADFLWRAEVYKEGLGVEYRRFLRRRFRKVMAEIDPCITHVVRLPFSHILTTNYDTCLEQAHQRYSAVEYDDPDWMDKAEMREFLFTFYHAPRRSYIHLHGRYDQPDSVVLSHSDYVKRYVISDEAAQRLLILFATHRIVFIGFSLSDPALMQILERVNSRLAVGDVKHYVFLAEESAENADFERRRLQKMYGIEPIFFRLDQTFSQFERVLASLVEQVRQKNPEKLLTARASKERTGKDALKVAPTSSEDDVCELPQVLRHQSEDPNKGAFGGKAEANGRRLSATVETVETNWYKITLTVEQIRKPRVRRLSGIVEFHLHPSFDPVVEKVEVKDGKAVLPVHAYGAFTVGAVADGGKTRLELDLAADTRFPQRFREQ